jgi:hypothetical protein
MKEQALISRRDSGNWIANRVLRRGGFVTPAPSDV